MSMKNTIEVKANFFINDYQTILNQTLGEFIYFNSKNEEIKTTISKRYKSTSIDQKYGQILYQTARYLTAQNFLELGTSLGVSSAYIGNSTENIKGNTIDFNPNAVDISKSLFARMKWSNIEFHCGRFEVVLPTILTEKNIDFCFIDGDHQYASTIHYVMQIKEYLSENSVIILDDIRWSEGMYRAWEELIKIPEFNYTIDFGRIGLLFKTTHRNPKQHFILK
jgi:predicted O-methyltransferase YrrM